MTVLIIHPVIQGVAIITVYCAAYLGLQRIRSLHFGSKVRFRRSLHAALGAAGLITMLSGLAGGLIIVSRVLDKPPLSSLHGKSGMTLVPFILIGIFTGFYLYVYPVKGKTLTIIHAFNNLVILVLVIIQLLTGIPLVRSVLGG